MSAKPNKQELERAEAAAAKLVAETDFAGIIQPMIDQRLTELLPVMNEPVVPMEQRVAIFTLAHDLKGSGDSYGYPCLSRVAASACRLLRPDVPESEPKPLLTEAHLEAMTAVLSLPLAAQHMSEIEEIADALEIKVQHHLAAEAHRLRN